MSTVVNAEFFQRLLIWVLFFATSVYGHVALKLAVGQGSLTYRESIKLAATSFWGWSTVIGWGLCAYCGSSPSRGRSSWWPVRFRR